MSLPNTACLTGKIEYFVFEPFAESNENGSTAFGSSKEHVIFKKHHYCPTSEGGRRFWIDCCLTKITPEQATEKGEILPTEHERGSIQTELAKMKDQRSQRLRTATPISQPIPKNHPRNQSTSCLCLQFVVFTLLISMIAFGLLGLTEVISMNPYFAYSLGMIGAIGVIIYGGVGICYDLY